MDPFLLMGAGKVHLDILTDAGVSTGLKLKGNCTKLSVKPDSEIVEEYGGSDEDLGMSIGSVTIPKPVQAEIEFNQMDADLFAMAFMGINSLLEQTAGSEDTGQTITTIADAMIELGKYQIADVVVTSTDDVTTYVEGTDYTVRPRVGGIIALSTGSIPAGGDVKVTYSWPDLEGSVMSGMTKSNIRARVLWEGINYADGREFIVDLYQGRFAPSSDFNFQNAVEKKFVRAGFKMSLEKPSGKSEPFKLVWLS